MHKNVEQQHSHLFVDAPDSAWSCLINFHYSIIYSVRYTFNLVPKTRFTSHMKSHIWQGSSFFRNELGAIDITLK